MVLNFFQLRNYTNFTFELSNSENAGDNYTVNPWETTARHDMWLAQGNGSKGVTILASCDGAPIRPLLYMWDQDWALRYRIDGQTSVQAIATDGNKDFSIDVRDDYFTFVCYNGSFSDSQSEVQVSEWKDQLTTSFSETVTDSNTVEYALDYVAADLQLDPEVRARSNDDLFPPINDKQKKAIGKLIAMWIDDYLDPNLGQGTLYSDGSGWRIDLQDNGAVERRGMHFYNIAVQYGSGSNNVYAHVLIPVGYVIGRRRIRNALVRSRDSRQVGNIIPPDNSATSSGDLQHDLLDNIPYTSEEAHTSWAIRSLVWLYVVGKLVMR